MEPAWHVGGSLVGVVIRFCVEPFAQGALDEAFGLSVGARAVWPGADMAQLIAPACGSEVMAFVGWPVIGHDALDGDAVSGEESQRALEESDGVGFALVGQDLGVSETGGVIDGDVERLPAGAAPVALACAMADAIDASEFLGVDVDEFTRPLALVADGLGAFIESLEAAEAAATRAPPQQRGP